MSRPCPVPGCGWTIADGSVMCAHHWQLLPSDLQRSVRNSQHRTLPPAQRERLRAKIREHVIESPL